MKLFLGIIALAAGLVGLVGTVRKPIAAEPRLVRTFVVGSLLAALVYGVALIIENTLSRDTASIQLAATLVIMVGASVWSVYTLKQKRRNRAPSATSD